MAALCGLVSWETGLSTSVDLSGERLSECALLLGTEISATMTFDLRRDDLGDLDRAGELGLRVTVGLVVAAGETAQETFAALVRIAESSRRFASWRRWPCTTRRGGPRRPSGGPTRQRRAREGSRGSCSRRRSRCGAPHVILS